MAGFLDTQVAFGLSAGMILLIVGAIMLLSRFANFPKIRMIAPGTKLIIGAVFVIGAIAFSSVGSAIGLGNISSQTASIAGGSTPSTSSTSSVLQVQQSTSVTATLLAVDALNTSLGAKYYAPTVLATSAGASPVTITVAASSVGGTGSLTYGLPYTIFAEPISTTQYGDVQSLTTSSNQPTYTFKLYTAAQPTLALYNTLNTEYVNSTFATTAYANYTGETTSSALTAGGTANNLQLRYQLTSAFTVFGDPREPVPVIVCTDANPSIFTITTAASSASVPAIAVSDGMRSCFVGAGGSYLSNANSGTSVMSFQEYLNAGQTFVGHNYKLYDATSFLDNTGVGVGHGYNKDTSTAGDVGAANPVIRVTQGTIAWDTNN